MEAWSDEEAGAEARPALEEALQAFVDASGKEGNVTPAELVAFAAARIPADGAPLEGLARLRAPDVRLACACLKGDETALALFSARFGQIVRTTLGRMGLVGASDEVEQKLVERLLVGGEGRPPALAMYSGRGPLDAYLRVAVTRAGYRLNRGRKREVSNDEVVERAVSESDPETSALRARYGPLVKTSFQEAIAQLAPRERRLLRYHYVQQLTTRQMGTLLGVHHTTVMRRLAQTRARLLEAARTQLGEALGGTTDVSDIVRVVESQLDLSLERVLATQT